jgi:hypothetical protein
VKREKMVTISEELDVNGEGEGGPVKAAGAQDILKPETDSTIISSLSPISQGFVELSAVDAASVLSQTLLSAARPKKPSWRLPIKLD